MALARWMREYNKPLGPAQKIGSYEGSVIAGRMWGGKMQEMKVPPATANSVEAFLHADSAENKLLIFNENSDLKEQYKDWLKHRAIGVVYHPSGERGNYTHQIIVPLRCLSLPG